MDDIDEEIILSHELRQLADEAMKNHARVEPGKNEARTVMALAQVVHCNVMMKYYVESEWDWRLFKQETAEVLTMQQTLYREARSANDRDGARIALARVRMLTTLVRRLADASRRDAITQSYQENFVWH